jgi:hypothetical protein
MAPYLEAFSVTANCFNPRIKTLTRLLLFMNPWKIREKYMRPKFEQFEAEGKLLSGCEHYEDEMKRNRQRNRRFMMNQDQLRK